MKKIFFAMLGLAALGSFAQDTIYTRGGEVIPAKVYEITPTEIKYKKPSNPDGPLYVTSKENVAVIEYKNGSKDVFQQTSGNTSTSNSLSQDAIITNNYYSNPRPRVNVVLAPAPLFLGAPWGYYRPYRYHYRHWHHRH